MVVLKKFKELSDDEKSLIGKGLHLCWFPDCGAVWFLDEGEYHDVCDTWKCPSCKRCFCDLPYNIQYALDAEGASSWGWNPWHNPRERKKRKSEGTLWLEYYWATHHSNITWNEFIKKVASGEIKPPPKPLDWP